jgi:hypothetical protein
VSIGQIIAGAFAALINATIDVLRLRPKPRGPRALTPKQVEILQKKKAWNHARKAREQGKKP